MFVTTAEKANFTVLGNAVTEELFSTIFKKSEFHKTIVFYYIKYFFFSVNLQNNSEKYFEQRFYN